MCQWEYSSAEDSIPHACWRQFAKRTRRIQTFSVAFGHESFDESEYARLLAKKFTTEHHEFHVSPKVMELLPKMAELFDEPFADPAAIPNYYLSQLTSDHVKVALSGDGGDEAFGGYQSYLALKALGWASRIPGGASISNIQRMLPYNSGERSRLRI